MHKIIIIPLFMIMLALPSISFSGSNTKLPTSPRARNAITKVTPALKKELAKLNLKLGDPIFIRIFKKEKQLEMWIKQNDSYKLCRIAHLCG